MVSAPGRPVRRRNCGIAGLRDHRPDPDRGRADCGPGGWPEGLPSPPRPAAGGCPAGGDLLFVVRADGTLAPVTQGRVPAPEARDTMVLLGPALAEAEGDPARTGRADA